MAGYSASGDSLSSASKKISDDASGTQQATAQSTATTIAAGDFGQAHGQHQGDYAAAMKELGAGLTGMTGTLTSFSTLLGQAATNYSSVEGSNTSTVNKAGS